MLKQALLRLGWPAEDRAGYVDGTPHLIGLDEGDWHLADPVGQVEHDLDGTRDGYQGAPVRVHLRDEHLAACDSQRGERSTELHFPRLAEIGQ